MDSSDPRELVSTWRVAPVFFLHALTLLGVASIGPLSLAYLMNRLSHTLVFPTFETVILPVWGTFAIAVLATLTIVQKITGPMTKRLRHQFLTLGYVEDYPGFFFKYFGVNLFIWVLIGILFLEEVGCQEWGLQAAESNLAWVPISFYQCSIWAYSVMACIAGIGIVFYLWVLWEVRLMEKETNQLMRVHYYKTR